MTHATVVADAQDSSVTLNRVVSLLRGRCFTVVSFTAAKSHRPGVARLTIVIDATRARPGRVAACLAKLADVWNVRELEPTQSLRREIALVKVLCPAHAQHTLAEAAPRGEVRVVHRDDSSMTLEIVAEPETVDAILGELDLPVVEFMRSGAIAMPLTPVADQRRSPKASTA